MANLLEMFRDLAAFFTPLFGNLIANTPHHDTRMIPIDTY